jgi:hypothetical protein
MLPLLFAAMAGAQAAPMTYPCYRAQVAPAIDGDIAGDSAWQGIPQATGFSVLGGTYAVAKQTTAQACWDEAALYVGMTCEEPDAPQMQFTVSDGGAAWLDDGIEVFVQPGTGPQVFQFVVTARGARGSGDVFPDIGRVEVGSRIGERQYDLELRIPFAILGATPKAGDCWRADFCRNIVTSISGGDHFTCWAPLKRRFLEPENFALLAFEGPAPDAEAAAWETERLNRGYRGSLVRRLRVAVAQAPEYEVPLREASADAEFGPRATALNARWGEARDALASAGRTPLQELRRIVAGADSLVKESYEATYAYLIARLLREN